MTYRITSVSLLLGLVAASLGNGIASADIPGKHPYYIHARSDLRQAVLEPGFLRVTIPDNAPQNRLDVVANYAVDSGLIVRHVYEVKDASSSTTTLADRSTLVDWILGRRGRRGELLPQMSNMKQKSS